MYSNYSNSDLAKGQGDIERSAQIQHKGFKEDSCFVGVFISEGEADLVRLMEQRSLVAHQLPVIKKSFPDKYREIWKGMLLMYKNHPAFTKICLALAYDRPSADELVENI